MEDEPPAAEGVLTSAAPELPPSRGSNIPTVLSPVEEAGLGLPAGSSANTEVKPLLSVAEVPPLRQVQNNIHAYLPGLGQDYLLAARQLASASALQLQSPRSSSLLADLRTSEEYHEPSEEPTAATPNAEQSRVPSRAELPLVGLSPFSPSGPQSTHGSSVGMGSPHTPSGDEVTQRQSGRNTTARLGFSPPRLGSRLLAMAKATRQFVKARADALLSPEVFPGGLEPPESALPGLVDPSHPVPTPAETRADATNVQPHSTHGTAISPDPEQTILSDGSSIPSLLAPGIQGKEVHPKPHLSTGIRREMEIPHAKAVASVSSLPILDSQVDAPIITGIRSDWPLISLRDSEVASTSQPRIGIQPGRATTDTQGEPLSHLPTFPPLPTTDPLDDLLLTGIRNDAVAPLPSSSVVAHASQPEIGIQLRRVATSVQSAQSPLSLPLTPDGSSPDVANIRRLLSVSPDISADILTDTSRPSSLISSDQSSIGIRSGLLSAPPSQLPLSHRPTLAGSLSDVANIRQLSPASADIPADISADISLPSSLISSDQPSVGIRSGLLSAPPSLLPALSAATPTSPDVAPLSPLPLSFVPLTASATPLSPAPSRDAVPPPAVPGLTSGGPACRSDPLPQSPPLPSLPSLSQPPPLSPSLLTPVPLLPPAVPLPSTSSRDVVPPPAVPGLTSGGPACHSDPLPQSPPLPSLPSLSQPPPLSPSLLTPVPLLPPAVPSSSTSSRDVVPPPAVPGLTSGSPVCRSDPLPQPPLSQSSTLPRQSPFLSPPPLSSVPLLPPAIPSSSTSSHDVVPSPAVPGLTSGSLACRSDPLPQPPLSQSSTPPRQSSFLSPLLLSPVPLLPPATLSPTAALPGAALPSVVAELAPGDPMVPNDPMPSSSLLQPLPSLPQSPSPPPTLPPLVSPPVPPPSPATPSSPASLGSAVTLPATAEPTPGGPNSRSDPLPALHALLTPHEGPLDVTYIHPQVPLEVMSSTPAASQHPLVVAPDAAPSPPTAEPTSGGPDSRSDPLPALHALLTPHEGSLDVTYIHPQVPLEVMSSTPAASQHPLVVAPDAAPSPPTAEPTSGGPDSRSDPLPALHALLTPHEGSLDVTYIHPQVPLEVMSSTPAAPPHPLVVAPDAAPSPPTAEPTSGGPDSRSDPLPTLHALLTPDEDSLDVTYIQPQLPLETMSSTPAAPPHPPVASPDAVPSPATAEPTPGGPDGRSDPLPPLHALLTPDEDLLGVTYIQPQLPLETMSSTPTAPATAAGHLTRCRSVACHRRTDPWWSKWTFRPPVAPACASPSR